MVAMELCQNGDPHQPDVELTKALAAEATTRGLIILTCCTYCNVVRIHVPLTADNSLIDEGLGIIAASLDALKARLEGTVQLTKARHATSSNTHLTNRRRAIYRHRVALSARRRNRLAYARSQLRSGAHDRRRLVLETEDGIKTAQLVKGTAYARQIGVCHNVINPGPGEVIFVEVETR